MQGVVARAPAMKMPLLCICYGHQLMDEAWGGTIGLHPKGNEIGLHEISVHQKAISVIEFA